MPSKTTANQVKPILNILPLRIREFFSQRLQWVYLQVHFFTAPETGNEQLCLAYLGNDKARARFWAKRVGGKEDIEDSGKKIWLWNLESYLRKHKPDCQLVMVETCRWSELLLFNKPGFKLPKWTQLALDSSKPINELKKASFRLEVEIPRLIRKNKLGYEISNSTDDLDEFIDQMHWPFIDGRHGDTAFYSSRKAIHEVFKNSDLIYVTQEGIRIGGAVVHYENGIATLRYVGVKDNRPDYFRSGCVGCFYYFGLKLAMEKGMSCFNFGGSSPILTDNVTYFKLSFKPYVMHNTYLHNHFIKMIFRKKDASLTRFLQGHPFVSVSDKGHFERHVFANEANIESVTQLNELFKKIQCGNVESTVIHVDGDTNRISSLLNQSSSGFSSFICKKWDVIRKI